MEQVIHVSTFIPRRVIIKGEESFTSQKVFKENCKAKGLKQEFPEGWGGGNQKPSAVLRKVVPQKHKSVRDNANWYYG